MAPSETQQAVAEAARDVELSNSDKTGHQEGQEGDTLDKAHKEERTLPDFFPSHGLTTAGEASGRGANPHHLAIGWVPLPPHAASARRRIDATSMQLLLLWVLQLQACGNWSSRGQGVVLA